MIIIREFKHNKHVHVDIPSGADLFARVGPRESSKSDYSGDVFINPSVSKVEAAQDIITQDSEFTKE